MLGEHHLYWYEKAPGICHRHSHIGSGRLFNFRGRPCWQPRRSRAREGGRCRSLSGAGFQKDCEGVTADYSLKAPGQIKVVNSCRKGSLQGKSERATGKAKVVDGSQNTKLRVSFFGPFYGDYWVLDRAEDYSWSIVGEPSGRYLWFLHRQPNPGAATLSRMKARAAELGYDVGLLRITQQPAS
jgi:lipocalin